MIEQLFKEGKTFAIQPFRVYYMYREADIQLRAGFGVSSKNFKKATVRNRIKRLMREAYRMHKLVLSDTLEKHPAFFYLFLIYTGREIPVHILATEKIGIILQRLAFIIHESIPEAS